MHWDTAGALLVFSLVHLAVMVSRLSQVCDLFSRLVGPVCIGQSVVFSRQYYRTLNWYWNITSDLMLYRNQPPATRASSDATFQHTHLPSFLPPLTGRGTLDTFLTQWECWDSFMNNNQESFSHNIFTVKTMEHGTPAILIFTVLLQSSESLAID